MPYNKSRGSVNRHLRYLEDMAMARRTLTWPAENPEATARKLREAMAAAETFPDFNRFHKLRSFYKIRVQTGFVEAHYIGPVRPEDYKVFTPERRVVPEVEDVHGVVGACIQLKAQADELNFPRAVLSEEDLHALWAWAHGEKWKLINHDGAGVTLTRRAVDDIYVWKPGE